MRRGFSLPELALVLALVGTLLALATPRLWVLQDHWAVDRAVHELITFYQVARFRAVVRSSRVRLEIRQDSLRAVFEGVTDSVAFVWPGPARHGVRLTASRAVITIGPTGIGWGGANTKLVLRRGEAGDSLTTSRLGRLKRWN